MKKSRGRPTKLTDELRDRIVELLSYGNYIETAAVAAGVHKDSLYEWLKRGAAEPASKYGEFSDAVQKAMALAESRDVLLIAKAAVSQWQAAAWRLERKNWDRWGRKERIEHVGQGGGPIQMLDLSKLSDDKLNELESILRQAGAGEGSDPDSPGD